MPEPAPSSANPLLSAPTGRRWPLDRSTKPARPRASTEIKPTLLRRKRARLIFITEAHFYQLGSQRGKRQMNVGSRLKILSAMIVVCSLAATLVRGQGSGQAQAAPQKELMAEDVYKNIQVFRGVPENQFLATMGFFCGSLSESCEFCHKSEATWAAYAEDNDMKNMARRMVLMMNA